jgi:hypothetical protein
VNSLTAGATIAALVAGWPLYQLVTAGSLDATSAVVRGAVVAAGCAAGVTFVMKLATGYEQQARREQTRRLNKLFNEMEGAATDGSLTDPGSAGHAAGDGKAGNSGNDGKARRPGPDAPRP